MGAKPAFCVGPEEPLSETGKMAWQLLSGAELSHGDTQRWTKGREQPNASWASSTGSYTGPQAAWDESSESLTAAARINPLSWILVLYQTQL